MSRASTLPMTVCIGWLTAAVAGCHREPPEPKGPAAVAVEARLSPDAAAAASVSPSQSQPASTDQPQPRPRRTLTRNQVDELRAGCFPAGALRLAAALASPEPDDIAPAELMQALDDAIEAAGWGHSGTPELVRHLCAATRHPQKDVRLYALAKLERSADRDATPSLTRLLRDRDPELRQRAAEVLAALRDPGAVPDLVAALRDPDAAVQRASVQALSRIGDRRPVPHLIDALERADDLALRRAIVVALRELTGQTGLPASASAWRAWLERGALRPE